MMRPSPNPLPPRSARQNGTLSVPQGEGNRRSGNFGERIAAEFLERKGYTILARQWRCKLGEIDIVAEQGKTLVIVEVKTRRGGWYGPPEFAINPQKSLRLMRLAEYYQSATHAFNRPIRVDVVAIELGREGTDAMVRHHENAPADLPFLDSRRRA